MDVRLNRAARCTAALLTAVALGGGAAACGSSSGSSTAAASGSSAAASASAASAQSGGAQGSGSSGSSGTSGTGSSAQGKSSSGSSGSSGSAGSSGAGTSSGSGGSRCHTSELKLSWSAGSPDMSATNQQSAMVVVKNIGTRTCTLYGFPGVRLISKTGKTWDLARSSVTPSVFTLKPGDDTANVSFTVMPMSAGDAGSSFAPSQVEITPPDETTHVTLSWPFGGTLLDQSAATHPGTFVDPIVA